VTAIKPTNKGAFKEEKKYRNVGVLKFLVAREGKKDFSDNAGTLNMLLARRLEVALVLANDRKNLLGIIRNASAVAARCTIGRLSCWTGWAGYGDFSGFARYMDSSGVILMANWMPGRFR
jgi:hypothetical protein